MSAVLTTAAFTACVDNSDNPAGITHTVNNNESVEPTTDQMGVSVTADLPAVALSQFEANSTATALMRRLPTTTSAIDIDTRVVMFKGSDFENGSPLTDEQMDEVSGYQLPGQGAALEKRIMEKYPQHF